MGQALSEQTIRLVKATVPALGQHGADITAAMYGRLFENPQMKALFNHANQGKGGAQVHALEAAILAYARNIDNLGALGPVVERISSKHIAFHILPEHYAFVAEALLGAIAGVLGDAATDDILAAWGEAYWFLADILRNRESGIRDELEQRDGGWTGWRDFVVAEKHRESDVITSFVLRPQDGRPVMAHKPGQYVTLRFDTAGAAGLKRNYSISCGPNNDHYRISVKREPGGQGGSSHLHDAVAVGTVVEMTPPTGDFFLPERPPNPVVLVSGGVGLTPMVSMVETIAAHHPELETHFVHGTMSSGTHAMGDHVRSLARAHGRTAVTTFYSDPAPADAVGRSHDITGQVTVEWLQRHTPFDTAEFYLCGPKPFLRALVTGLLRAGVPNGRVHYEFFGPADELLAA